MIFINTLLGVLIPLLVYFLSKKDRTKERLISLLLLYALIFHVGVQGFFLGLIPHVFFADMIAESIGWGKGSPFQFEVGLHDGAWGLLGFLSIWIKGTFWYAAGIGWSFFMLGAAFGHLRETILKGNYEIYNFYMIFIDAFIAFYLLLLIYMHYKISHSKVSEQKFQSYH